MPKNRILAHEFVKRLVDSNKATFTQLARFFGVDRTKVYRIYYGWDVADLPAQWSDEETEFVKANYGAMSLQEIADNLRRTKSGVEHRVYILKLAQQKRNGISKSRILANPAANG